MKRIGWKPEPPQSDTERAKEKNGGKYPIGLQRLSVCRNDVICFHKTQFKFVPAFPELQRWASVETSADYISGVRECALHQNPTNSRGGALPSLASICFPYLKPGCAAAARWPPSRPLLLCSNCKSVKASYKWFTGDPCQNQGWLLATLACSFHRQVTSKGRRVCKGGFGLGGFLIQTQPFILQPPCNAGTVLGSEKELYRDPGPLDPQWQKESVWIL